MKPLDIDTINNEMNQMNRLIRQSIMMVGVVTAIVGLLTLSLEVQPILNDDSLTGLTEISHKVATDVSIQISGKAMTSVLWPF